MKSIEHQLTQLGFSQKAAKIYIAAISLGDSSINDIAKHSGVQRTTVYTLLDELETRGLIGTYKSSSGIRVRPQNPKALVGNVEKQMEEAQSLLPVLQSLLPESDFAPAVTHFSGKRGYQSVLDNALRSHASTLLFLGSGHEILEVVSKKYITEHFIPKRMQHKIRSRELIFEVDVDLFDERDQIAELRQIKMLPSEHKWASTKMICNDSVAFFSSPQEASCMVIESEAIADMERKNFSLLWEMSESI